MGCTDPILQEHIIQKEGGGVIMSNSKTLFQVTKAFSRDFYFNSLPELGFSIPEFTKWRYYISGVIAVIMSRDNCHFEFEVFKTGALLSLICFSKMKSKKKTDKTVSKRCAWTGQTKTGLNRPEQD